VGYKPASLAAIRASRPAAIANIDICFRLFEAKAKSFNQPSFTLQLKESGAAAGSNHYPGSTE
jgi:hypothetical protein